MRHVKRESLQQIVTVHRRKVHVSHGHLPRHYKKISKIFVIGSALVIFDVLIKAVSPKTVIFIESLVLGSLEKLGERIFDSEE